MKACCLPLNSNAGKTKMEWSNLNGHEQKKSLTRFSKKNKIVIFAETTWQYKAKWLQSYNENHQIEIRTGCQVFRKWNHWLLIYQNNKCHWFKRNSGKKCIHGQNALLALAVLSKQQWEISSCSCFWLDHNSYNNQLSG